MQLENCRPGITSPTRNGTPNPRMDLVGQMQWLDGRHVHAWPPGLHSSMQAPPHTENSEGIGEGGRWWPSETLAKTGYPWQSIHPAILMMCTRMFESILVGMDLLLVTKVPPGRHSRVALGLPGRSEEDAKLCGWMMST